MSAEPYIQCTVSPYLPQDWFTGEDIENLSLQGFHLVDAEDDKEDHFYIFVPEYLIYLPFEDEEPFDDEEMKDCTKWTEVFQNILKRENSDIQIIVEGCFYDTGGMEIGDFGGFCTIITKDHIFNSSTKNLIEEFRAKIDAEKNQNLTD